MFTTVTGPCEQSAGRHVAPHVASRHRESRTCSTKWLATLHPPNQSFLELSGLHASWLDALSARRSRRSRRPSGSRFKVELGRSHPFGCREARRASSAPVISAGFLKSTPKAEPGAGRNCDHQKTRSRIGLMVARYV